MPRSLQYYKGGSFKFLQYYMGRGGRPKLWKNCDKTQSSSRLFDTTTTIFRPCNSLADALEPRLAFEDANSKLFLMLMLRLTRLCWLLVATVGSWAWQQCFFFYSLATKRNWFYIMFSTCCECPLGSFFVKRTQLLMGLLCLCQSLLLLCCFILILGWWVWVTFNN